MRLSAQRIDAAAAPGRTISETARHLLATQAQDFAQSLWAVGARTPGAVRSDVIAALADGSVVRSLPIRGTLHLVAAGDLNWMLALTAQRTLQGATTRHAALGLDQQTLERAATVVADALEGGNSLTRAEFMELLERKGVSAEGQRGYHIIFYLAQIGLVCWGPPRGTQQALVLVEEWIPRPRLLDRDESLREFALRYFTGHGPATERDFAWWTKLTLKDVRAGIAAAASELTELVLGETTYLVATCVADTATASDSPAGVYALPGFDEYLLGYQDRGLPLAAEHSARIVPGLNGIFLPIIVSRGRVAGTWRRVPKSTAIEPEHFAPASGVVEKGFARAAQAYARFLDG
ncbi:MAG: hypothetical protein JWR53_2006 [Glaciihabitans sp.]|nr:hypothetical protein [Glaciihabitans sp.]